MKTLRLLAVLTLIAALTGTTTKAKAGEFQDILSCDGGCGKYWFDAEYLFLKTSGSKLPPLVTGNPLGTPAAEAGVIGADSTEILSGNHAISDDSRSGYRFGGGAWLTCNLGVEIDYFQLSDADYNSRYDASSGLIIGRPFINLSPPLGADPRWDTQLVNFPPFGTGYVRVSGSSKFDGYGARFKWNLFRDCCYAAALCGGSGCDGGCEGGCEQDCCDQACCEPVFARSRAFNVTFGYRHLDLQEYVRVDEQLITAGDEFQIYDFFGTDNKFNGLEIGCDWEGGYRCFCFDAFSRVAVGMNASDIRIAGQTIDDTSGVFETREGGILAQSSNIGNRSCNLASMMMQLGFNGKTQLTDCIGVNAGYSLLYWSNVARAAEQIDMQVNPGLFPAPVAPLGTIGALPTHVKGDFVAHGLNLGLTAIY